MSATIWLADIVVYEAASPEASTRSGTAREGRTQQCDGQLALAAVWRTATSHSNGVCVRVRHQRRLAQFRRTHSAGHLASLAQLVEHSALNRGVPGSSPGGGTINGAAAYVKHAQQGHNHCERPGLITRGLRQGLETASGESARALCERIPLRVAAALCEQPVNDEATATVT